LGGRQTSGAEVKRFEMPRFDAGEEPFKASEYIFQPLEGTGDPARTYQEAKTASERMLKEARAGAKVLKAEAEKIRNKAQAEGREQGLAEGRAQGRAEGQEEGRAGFEAGMAPLVQAFQAVQGLYQDLWKTSEATLVRLALKAAERLVHHELSLSPELVAEVFKAALDQLQEQHRAVFRINPEDLEILETARSQALEQVKGLVKISFEPDSDLARGELVMETEAGKVDATLKQRINALAEVMDGILSQKMDLDW